MRAGLVTLGIATVLAGCGARSELSDDACVWTVASPPLEMMLANGKKLPRPADLATIAGVAVVDGPRQATEITDGRRGRTSR